MMQRKKSLQSELIMLTFILLLLAYLIFKGSTLPFVGPNAWNFNIYSQIAKNYTTFGIVETKLAPIINVSEQLPVNPLYYLHHPQLLSLVQSIFFTFFGESYFIARLPVLLATLISAIVVLLIGRELKNLRFGMIAMMVAVIIPGFSVFGRMIGQEAFVLMFVLICFYSLEKYLGTGKKPFLFMAIFSIVLGVLSDWPMAYFVFFLSPYLLVRKNIKLYFKLLSAAFVTCIFFLCYISWIQGGLSDLFQAFLVRGPGALLQQSNWYLLWPLTIAFRLILYVNPLILLFAGIGSFFALQMWRRNKNTYLYILLSLFLFGAFHIVLYPEGSYGHAYWVIYLIPFFIFSSSLTFERLYVHRRNIFATSIVFSLVYLSLIDRWKSGEIESNMYRFYIANEASKFIPEFSTVTINTNSVIDADLLEYSFSYSIVKNSERITYPVIHSCLVQCGENELYIYRNNPRASETVISSPDATAHVFTVTDDVTRKKYVNVFYDKEKNDKSVLRELYVIIKGKVKAPQL